MAADSDIQVPQTCFSSCPFCGSDQSEITSKDIDEMHVTLGVECEDCCQEWQEVYKASFYVFDSDQIQTLEDINADIITNQT